MTALTPLHPNVRAFLDRIATPPAWITEREAGAGFVELADFLLDGQDGR